MLLVDHPSLAPGEVIAGKYRLDRVLGRGGMGVVCAGWHLELDQPVALKFVHPQLTDRLDAVERFRREARATAKLRSEHVVRVLDVGTSSGGLPYLVMEYLDGRDLEAELEERTVLPIPEALHYLLQAIEAVAEAHAVGIVHRDLKPSNLFLANRPDGSRSVKVLDFGISKSALGAGSNLSLTQTATLLGSPLYMSPEQMDRPKEVDPRSDIWSIGAIAYTLLAGRAPFEAQTMPQLCKLLLHADPEPLRQLRPEIPEALDRAILRCLEKDRVRRWPSLAELAQVLVGFAPASSHINATRASRVLGSAEISLRSLERSAVTAVTPPPDLLSVPGDGDPVAGSGAASRQATMPSGDVTAESGDAVAGSGRMSAEAAGVAEGSGSVTAEKTQASWGQNATLASQQAHRRRRTHQFVALAGGLLLATAGASFLWLGRGEPPKAASPAVPSAPPPPVAAAAPPEPTPVVETPSPAASSPAADAVDGGAVKPDAAVVPKPPAPAAQRPSKPAPRSKPAAKPPSPRTPKPTQSGITDFGGRR